MYDYDKLIRLLRAVRKEHRKLMDKAVKKKATKEQLSPEEKKKLHAYIKLHNTIEKLLRDIK